MLLQASVVNKEFSIKGTNAGILGEWFRALVL